MNKKMKIVYRICLVAIIAFSAVNVYVVLGDKIATDITLLDIIALADNEGGNYSCSSGGPGSSSCSVSFVVAGASTSCQVTCESGYYACCNAYENKCQCRN
jgi:hypothetical protein